MIFKNILMILINYLIKLFIQKINSEELLFIMLLNQDIQNVMQLYKIFYKFNSIKLIILIFFYLFLTIYRNFNLLNKENQILENIEK